MLFRKPKPSVTPEDKEWVEVAFLWFENKKLDSRWDQSPRDLVQAFEEKCGV
jgi:hypothetical protein